MEVDICNCLYSSCNDASPGKYGIQVGNQQFTVRNLTVKNAAIGLSSRPLISHHALNIHIDRQLSLASGIGVTFNSAKFRLFLHWFQDSPFKESRSTTVKYVLNLRTLLK